MHLATLTTEVNQEIVVCDKAVNLVSSSSGQALDLGYQISTITPNPVKRGDILLYLQEICDFDLLGLMQENNINAMQIQKQMNILLTLFMLIGLRAIARGAQQNTCSEYAVHSFECVTTIWKLQQN
ncbi:hypothetical protein ACJX0J_029626, partial [Zea mays]